MRKEEIEEYGRNIRINEKDAMRVYKESVTPDIARLDNYLRELVPPPKETKRNAFFAKEECVIDLS